MSTRHARQSLVVLFALIAAAILLFGVVGAAHAEGEPVWRVQITAQLPAEEAAAAGGLAGLQGQIAGVQAYGAQAVLEDLGQTAEGWSSYRLTLQGDKLESFRQAVWSLPQAFSLLGGAAELTLNGAAEGELTLILESNPSTGYGWDITLPEGFSRVAEDTSERKAPGDVVGAPERLTLHLKGSGQAALALRYRRSFEPEEAVLRQITVNAPLSGTIDLSNPYPTDYGPEPEALPVTDLTAQAEVEAEALPANFDWRTKVITDEHGTLIPVVPGVRNQGACGSCYAFGTTGVMEIAMNRKRDVADLSEQFLVSCTLNYNKGCAGGYTGTHKYHFNTLAQQQVTVGAVLEADMPYTSGRDGSVPACVRISSHPYRLTSWATLRMVWYEEPTTAELKSAIYNYGPITAGICVADNNTDPQFFKQYRGGYFSHDEGGYCNYNAYPSTNHEVILVGWETYNGATYFILRNSWGAGWGENGYMKIKAGTSNLGQEASFVNYNSKIDHTAPYVTLVNSFNPTADDKVSENETIRVGVKRLNVYYNEVVHSTAASPEAAFSLFNKSDDKIVPVNSVTFNSTAKASYVYVNNSFYLPDADYSFTINSYYIRDAADHALDGDHNGVMGENFVRNFRISRSPLPPALIYPPNNTYLNDDSPVITWADAPTALNDRYYMQLARSADFSINRLIDTSLYGNSVQYNDLPDGNYYWRVRSYNRFDYLGPWSPTYLFVVDTKPPARPVLLTPRDNYPVKGTPSYTWLAASGAYKYQLHVWNPLDKAAYDYYSPWTTLLTLKPPLQPAAPTTGTEYKWEVQAIDRAGNLSPLSPTRTVIIKQPTPGVPVILGPANGAYLNDTKDLLRWKPVDYAVSYQVQISKSSTFLTKVYDEVITDTLLDLSKPLAVNGIYYWRVRAINGEGVKGAYTAARYFILDYTPPAVPALVKPLNGVTLAARPTFYWKAASGAYQYQLHIYNAGYDYVSPWTSYLYRAAPSSLINGSYQWQVKARDRAGNESSYSPPWSFTLSIPY